MNYERKYYEKWKEPPDYATTSSYDVRCCNEESFVLCLLLQMNEPGGIDQSHQLNVCVRVFKFSFFWP